MCKWNQSIGEIWKQAGPPMRSLSSSKDVPFPISKQFLWLLHKTPQHTPTSLSAPQPPSPLILPHPCPTPRGQMLGKTAASGGLRVWVCSAFGCVFVACVACGLIDTVSCRWWGGGQLPRTPPFELRWASVLHHEIRRPEGKVSPSPTSTPGMLSCHSSASWQCLQFLLLVISQASAAGCADVEEPLVVWGQEPALSVEMPEFRAQLWLYQLFSFGQVTYLLYTSDSLLAKWRW